MYKKRSDSRRVMGDISYWLLVLQIPLELPLTVYHINPYSVCTCTTLRFGTKPLSCNASDLQSGSEKIKIHSFI